MIAKQSLQIQKRTMALAGVFLTAFLLLHAATNLSLFWEQSAQQFYDWYQQPWIQWPVLALFIVALTIHVRIAIVIRKRNAQARTVDYHKHDKFHVPAPLVTISISLLLLFILFHLYQSLTLNDELIQAQVKSWFSSPLIALVYLTGLVILSAHLLHALVNVLQTLGMSSKTYTVIIATGVAVLFVGFVSVPVSFFWSV